MCKFHGALEIGGGDYDHVYDLRICVIFLIIGIFFRKILIPMTVSDLWGLRISERLHERVSEWGWFKSLGLKSIEEIKSIADLFFSSNKQ